VRTLAGVCLLAASGRRTRPRGRSRWLRRRRPAPPRCGDGACSAAGGQSAAHHPGSQQDPTQIRSLPTRRSRCTGRAVGQARAASPRTSRWPPPPAIAARQRHRRGRSPDHAQFAALQARAQDAAPTLAIEPVVPASAPGALPAPAYRHLPPSRRHASAAPADHDGGARADGPRDSKKHPAGTARTAGGSGHPGRWFGGRGAGGSSRRRASLSWRVPSRWTALGSDGKAVALRASARAERVQPRAARPRRFGAGQSLTAKSSFRLAQASSIRLRGGGCRRLLQPEQPLHLPRMGMRTSGGRQPAFRDVDQRVRQAAGPANAAGHAGSGRGRPVMRSRARCAACRCPPA
jgi:hypothetical protein